MQLSDLIATVVGMLIVAMAVALAVRRLRLPYTIVLVAVGLVIALTRRVPSLTLSADQYEAICYYLLLPALLFEAALNLKWEALSRNWQAIVTLAVPGTLVSIGLVGLLAHWALGVPLLQALLLGAIISPTDPLSVLAMFRELGVSKRLAVLVEGESLFNDAVGLVVFTILLGAMAPGAQTGILDGLAAFVIVSLGGAVVGLVVGLGASHLTRQVDDHLIEVTLSTVTAYGSFVLAEELSIAGHHLSGIIAVVVAGLCMGNYGKTTGMTATTVVALHTFWEYAAFVVNSLVFLLIGTELSVLSDLPRFSTVVFYPVAVFVMLTAARAVVAYGGGAAISRLWQPVPMAWRHTLVWGGLKGALSMVMVLGVPPLLRQWQGFDFLLTVAFGVVFLSLMAQGLSIRGLVGRLGLVPRDEQAEGYSRLVAQIVAHRAALAELSRLSDAQVIGPRLCGELTKPHREALARLAAQVDNVSGAAPSLMAAQTREAQRMVHHAQKGALLDTFERGLISESVLEQMVSEIDEAHRRVEAEEALESTHPDDCSKPDQ